MITATIHHGTCPPDGLDWTPATEATLARPLTTAETVTAAGILTATGAAERLTIDRRTAFIVWQAGTLDPATHRSQRETMLAASIAAATGAIAVEDAVAIVRRNLK